MHVPAGEGAHLVGEVMILSTARTLRGYRIRTLASGYYFCCTYGFAVDTVVGSDHYAMWSHGIVVGPDNSLSTANPQVQKK